MEVGGRGAQLPKLVMRPLVHTASLHTHSLFEQDYHPNRNTDERSSLVFVASEISNVGS